MAYGTAAQVAALVRTYTSGGAFTTSTNPTLATVTDWLDTISADLDVDLAAAGFSVPVTQATCIKSLAGVATEKAADLAKAANSTGRFFTTRAQENGVSPMTSIRNEIKTWVEKNTAGFIALGAAHTSADQREATLTAGTITLALSECGDGTSVVAGDL